MTNRDNLSPEARALIERTINWLTPKGRWVKTWAKFRLRDGREIEIDEPEELYDRAFHNYESYDGWDYDGERPLDEWKGDPTSSCLVGSLIINNNYQRDEVFEEAVLFLEKLARKSGKINAEAFYGYCDKEAYGDSSCACEGCQPDLNELDPDQAIERLVSLNDDQKYSHKRHVLDLFRRAVRRK